MAVDEAIQKHGAMIAFEAAAKGECGKPWPLLALDLTIETLDDAELISYACYRCLSAKPWDENFDHSGTLPAAHRLHVSLHGPGYPLRKITGLHHPHPSGLILMLLLLNPLAADGEAPAFNTDVDLIDAAFL